MIATDDNAFTCKGIILKENDIFADSNNFKITNLGNNNYQFSYVISDKFKSGEYGFFGGAEDIKGNVAYYTQQLYDDGWSYPLFFYVDPKFEEGWQANSIDKWYQLADGTYPKKTWKFINNNWYYFDDRGYMVHDQWQGNYYLKTDGTMAKNAWIGNYFVDQNGVWLPNTKNTVSA